jgi:hypothetical protein
MSEPLLITLFYFLWALKAWTFDPQNKEPRASFCARRYVSAGCQMNPTWKDLSLEWEVNKNSVISTSASEEKSSPR